MLLNIVLWFHMFYLIPHYPLLFHVVPRCPMFGVVPCCPTFSHVSCGPMLSHVVLCCSILFSDLYVLCFFCCSILWYVIMRYPSSFCFVLNCLTLRYHILCFRLGPVLPYIVLSCSSCLNFVRYRSLLTYALHVCGAQFNS